MVSNTIWPRNNQAFRLTLEWVRNDIPNNRSLWRWSAEHYQGGYSFGPGNTWRLSGFAVGDQTPWNVNYDGWRTLGSGDFWKGHDSSGHLPSQTFTLTLTSDNVYVIPDGSASVSVSSPVPPAIARGPRVNDNGTWKQSVAYVNDNDTWKMAIPYVNDNGTWKIAGG